MMDRVKLWFQWSTEMGALPPLIGGGTENLRLNDTYLTSN